MHDTCCWPSDSVQSRFGMAAEFGRSLLGSGAPEFGSGGFSTQAERPAAAPLHTGADSKPPTALAVSAKGLIGWRESIEDKPESVPPAAEVLQALVSLASASSPRQGVKRFVPGRDMAISVNSANLVLLGSLLAVMLPLCNVGQAVGFPVDGHRAGSANPFWLVLGLVVLGLLVAAWVANKHGLLQALSPSAAVKMTALGISDQSVVEIFLATFCCICLLFQLNHEMGASPFCFTLIPKMYQISDPADQAVLEQWYRSTGTLMEVPSNVSETELPTDYVYYGFGCAPKK